MYLSDVATRFEYRNQGIGTHLFEHAIRHLEVLGYDYIYLRTNEENSMSYGIAKRCGFVQLFDIIEEVERIDPAHKDVGRMLHAVQDKWQICARAFPLDNREDKKLWARGRKCKLCKRRTLFWKKFNWLRKYKC